MNTCPFCHKENVFYENYDQEKKTYRLWNCIACNFRRKVKKENLKDLDLPEEIKKYKD
jgi:transcription elongation factor Elf1